MFYGLVGSFVFGVALQTIYTIPLGWWVLLALGTCILFLCTLRCLAIVPKLHDRCLLVAACCIAALIGAIRLEYAEQQFVTTVYDSQLGETHTIVGVVRQEPDIRETQKMLYLDTEETVVLVSVDRQYSVQYGDLVEVTGRLERPDRFTTELGRTFDYAGYLQAKGVAYRMSFAEVAVIDTGHGYSVLSALLQFKQSFMTMTASVLPEPAAGLSAGLLLGVKQALGEDLEIAFRKTGIIHIVVLSGYNVMLVVAFVTTILGYFLSLRARVVVGVFAITAFALLVGLSATVVRASVMATLFLFAKMIGRSYQVIRALFLAGFLMVCINPFIVVYDIGFQLSFMATLGLLLVAPRLEVMLMQTPQWFGVRDFFLATVATQIAVLPILLYQIGELSIVSVPVNMLVLPMVPLAMLGTFVVGMFGYLSTSVALIVAYPTYLSLQYIIVIAEYFAQLPLATIWVPAFSFWWVLVGYGLLGGLLYLWSRHAAKLVPAPDHSTRTPGTTSAHRNADMARWQIELESETIR